MKKTLLILLLIGATLGLGAQNEKPRVAVFEPTAGAGCRIDDGTKLAMQEIMSSTLVNSGRYIIVERSMIDKVLSEQSFNNSDIVNNAQATEIGKLAGANKIVLTTIAMVNVNYMVSMKLIDVQTATVERQKTMMLKPNQLLDSIELIVWHVIGSSDGTSNGNLDPRRKAQLEKESAEMRKDSIANSKVQAREARLARNRRAGIIIRPEVGMNGYSFGRVYYGNNDYNFNGNVTLGVQLNQFVQIGAFFGVANFANLVPTSYVGEYSSSYRYDNKPEQRPIGGLDLRLYAPRWMMAFMLDFKVGYSGSLKTFASDPDNVIYNHLYVSVMGGISIADVDLGVGIGGNLFDPLVSNVGYDAIVCGASYNLRIPFKKKSVNPTL